MSDGLRVNPSPHPPPRSGEGEPLLSPVSSRGVGAGGEEEEALSYLGEGTVSSCTFRGEQVLVRVVLGDTMLLASVRPSEAPHPGETVGVALDPEEIRPIPSANPSWLEEA